MIQIILKGAVSTICGYPRRSGYFDGDFTNSLFSKPVGITAVEKRLIESSSGNNNTNLLLFVSDMDNQVIRKIDLECGKVTTLCGRPNQRGFEEGIGNAATLCFPFGIVADKFRKCLFVCDTNTLRKIDILSGNVVNLCGDITTVGSSDGEGQAAQFSRPTYLALGNNPKYIFISDTDNHAIRKADCLFFDCSTSRVD